MSDQEKDSVRTPFHREGDALVFDPPPDQGEAARQRRENEQHEFAREQVKTNKTLAWFTGALVVATFCTIGVGIWQGVISQRGARAAEVAAEAAKSAAKTANDSLGEIQHGSGATDTHTLAQQAVTQAIQTTNLANATKTQSDETRRLANEALEQVKAANALAIQAQRSADYAKQSIDTSILAERPWVGVVSFGVDTHEEGKTAKARYTFNNTGKRPATASMRVARVVFKNLPTAPFAGSNAPSSVAFMLPGSATSTVFTYEVPEGLSKNIKAKAFNEFFIAEITYSDVQTGQSYITHYCAYFDPTNSDLPFPLCTRYNETTK